MTPIYEQQGCLFLKGLFGLRGEGGGAKRRRVELAKNQADFQSTLLYSPSLPFSPNGPQICIQLDHGAEILFIMPELIKQSNILPSPVFIFVEVIDFLLNLASCHSLKFLSKITWNYISLCLLIHPSLILRVTSTPISIQSQP